MRDCVEKVGVMGDLLQQLENNEAILLMYLAGELLEEDRAEVEQMLSSDAGLRAMLAELSSLQDEVGDALAGGDREGSPARRDAAVRQVSRAVAARRSDAVRQTAVVRASAPWRLRIAWWMYPVAAAAALVIMMLLFSDGRPLNLPAPDGSQPLQYVDVSPRILDVSDDPALVRLRQVEQQVESEVLSLRTDSNLFDTDLPDLDR